MSFEAPSPGTDLDAPGGCDPDEVALKSFFLGPQSENAEWFRQLVERVLSTYIAWRRRIHPDDGRAISEEDRSMASFRARKEVFATELDELLRRFEEEMPKFSPRYIGHMFSETSMPAMLGHFVTLLHNPNNVSGESSRVGVELEAEAIEALAQMLGLPDGQGFGHFTSGGTVANFEAMVRARHRMERFIAASAAARARGSAELSLFEAAHIGWDRFDTYCRSAGDEECRQYLLSKANPFEVAKRLAAVFDEPYRGPVVLVPDHKHYSWVKGVELTGIGSEAFWSIRLDERGAMCVDHLAARIEEARQQKRPIMMVVSVAGTTELGAFDPVDAVQDILDEYAVREGLHIYHHVDAAYGGFFAANVCARSYGCIMGQGVRSALRAISRANSLTLDPHKLGYVPYSSGAFLARRAREYFSNEVDAPYIDFDEAHDRGPQTIEGSRSAAGAVATLLTARTIGLNGDGYGRILRRAVEATKGMQRALEELDAPVRIAPISSNILAFCVAREGEALSETNERTQRIYDVFSPQRDGQFYVSRTILRFAEYEAMLHPFVDRWGGRRDSDELMMIRLTVMNPFIDSRETAVDYAREFAEAVGRLVENEG